MQRHKVKRREEMSEDKENRSNNVTCQT